MVVKSVAFGGRRKFCLNASSAISFQVMGIALPIILFTSFPFFSVLLESKLHGLQHQACSPHVVGVGQWEGQGAVWRRKEGEHWCLFPRLLLPNLTAGAFFLSVTTPTGVGVPAHWFQSSWGSENTLPSPFPFNMGCDVSSFLKSSSSSSPLLIVLM